jgi:hypothetical protein
VLKNLSGDWPSILQGDCITKHIYFTWGHKHLALGNRVAEKERFLFVLFPRELRGDFVIFCEFLKIFIETGRQSYREIVSRTIYMSL